MQHPFDLSGRNAVVTGGSRGLGVNFAKGVFVAQRVGFVSDLEVLHERRPRKPERLALRRLVVGDHGAVGCS